MDYYLAWLIPLAPLIAAIICSVLSLLGRGKDSAHLPVWVALTASSVASLILLGRIDVHETGSIFGGYSWLEIGQIQVAVSLQLDAISLVQINVVTFVSALVAFYARGYMQGDPGFARFFAVFSGFVASMALLVLTNNLLVLYAFWEGVGLCSYLLIGYWFHRPAAAQAATKAFLVNRIADCGFLIGILLLWYVVGDVAAPTAGTFSRLDFNVIFESLPAIASQHPTLLVVIAVCLLMGAIGKSAQFPLHVWLPDAMEGPTPVSALIHAATMVTAGVYLLCRMSPLFVLVPDVLTVAGWIGGITAVLAALIALCQHDLKRVLAYSTVSQLGYMFMAISCGVSNDLMSVAVMAALFHVATHAFFKALLFLSAGNVMHAMGDEIDMRHFGGLRHVLPVTHILFAVGAAALAGFPLLSGFWSKDGILALLSHMSHDTQRGGSFFVLMLCGYFTAFLTAVYSFRAYFRTFHGPKVLAKSAGSHAHEMPFAMLWQLGVLAIGACFLGVLLAKGGFLKAYMEQIAYLPILEEPPHGIAVPVISAVMCFVGILIAWISTRKKIGQASTGGILQPLANAGYHRFYLDELYVFCAVRPLEALSKVLSKFDVLVVDGLWRRFTQIPSAIGHVLRPMQSGSVSNYAGWMTAGTIVLLLVIIWGAG